MFKITQQELHEILFEELPDVLATSDVSDFEDETEVSTSIDKTINNNFDRTFNTLVDLQNESSLVSINHEEVGLLSEHEDDIDEPEALNEPAGYVGLVQNEPAQKDGPDLVTSGLVYDDKYNNLPGSSKTEPKKHREKLNEEVGLGLAFEDEYGIDDPKALNEPVGLVQNDDPSLDNSELVYDTKTNSLPDTSKTKPKKNRKKYDSSKPSSPIPKPDKTLKKKCAKPSKPVGIKGNSKVGNEKKPSKRQIEERARAWKKKHTCLPETPYDIHEGVVESIFDDCKSATDVFLKLFDEEIVKEVTYQTNLYATQQGKNLNLKENELLVFLGINFVMGYHVLPSISDYWSRSEDLRVPIVADAMTRDRFMAILSNLHINDNHLIDPNKPDKLHKLRPLIDKLNKRFKDVYRGTREVSVDESMIRFKGRSSLKQYNPMKPIKRGYKLWCVADQTGFILKFKVYEGKDDKVEEEFKDFGLGERVVLSLTKDFWGTGRIVVFDNYFASVKLLERLKAENILACATIRPDRMAVPTNFVPDEKMKRGESDFRFSNLDIGCFKWMDNKSVLFISNYHGSEQTTIKRKQPDGTTNTYSCPQVVKDYNTFMGGVDKADHLRSLYLVDRKSKKWWHRLFWGVLDITFVNAYSIYCQLFDRVTVIEFRRNVSQGLISLKSSGVKKRSLSSPGQSDKKRRKQEFSVPKDVRETNRGIHWPTFVENRGRCEVCSKKKVQSRPHSKCSHCKVFLCVNEKKNCFVEYHGVSM